MQTQNFAILAGGVILWFLLSFVTKTWVRHWIAAILAGVATAVWRWDTMLEVAAAQGLEPMSPFRFGLIAVAGMLILASAGMGLFLLLGQMKRPR